MKMNKKKLKKHLPKQIKKNENLPEDERQFQIEFGNEGKNISQTTKNEIEEANIQGINFIEDDTRYYHNGVFVSYILGFVSSDENSDENEFIYYVVFVNDKNTFLST